MTYSGQGITDNCQIMDYNLFGGGSGNMKNINTDENVLSS